MKHHLFIIGITILSLGACSTAPISIESGKEFFDAENKYSLAIPLEFKTWTTYSEGLDGVAYPYFRDESVESNEGIIIRPDYGSCPSFGITKPQRLPRGSWGKVDAWDRHEMEGYEVSEEFLNSPCKDLDVNDEHSTYAFCSERNGKAVAICLKQMADNDMMAKKIFESFRWTD